MYQIKEFFVTPSFQNKIEFWAATTIFVFAVLFLFTGEDRTNLYLFEKAGVPFDYEENHLLPKLIQACLVFGGFLVLNFKVIPGIVAKRRLTLNILALVVVFLLVGLGFGITNTYYKEYLFPKYDTNEQAHTAFFIDAYRHAFWLLFVVGFYSFVKFASYYLLSNSEAIRSRFKLLTQDALAAFVVWMVSMFLLVIAGADIELILGWGAVGPSAILFYCFSFYYLIPKSLGNKRPFLAYFGRTFLLLAVLLFPVALLLHIIGLDDGDSFGTSMFNSFFQFFITAPLSWVLYKRRQQGSEEVVVLQKELGKSNASLDFLRSQINPHFLFNALNTLYGTALQENSERTAQGIQMLGDMMRFMLHENLQQKILLSREIEYMRNYIDLQLLRTSNSPNIAIQTKIEEVVDDKFIAPMLLIPFVENAFKHGISLKNQSWIKITLHADQNKVYFDVYNSTHGKPDNDPEKDKSGIGLVNVKQRLALLYPGRHELIIRDTPEEYFVHLTITL